MGAEAANVPAFKAKGLDELNAIRIRSTALSGEVDRNAPRMLILVGIPGCGKSTFAERLENAHWGIRLSQDDLGTRNAVERGVIAALKEGTNVIIDRCNFDKSQRKHWTDYARARGCYVGVIVFAVPFGTCLKRVRERPSHPTLKGGEEGTDSIVLRMANSFVFPDRQEGFLFCRVIKGDEDVERVLMEMLEAQ